MWDGHHAHFNVAKHKIELLNEEGSAFCSKSVLGGPKKREFQLALIDEMLLQKIFEPEQTAWTA